MAKPIKDTPMLKGKDLIEFYRNLQKSEKMSIEEKKKEISRIRESAKQFIFVNSPAK